MKTVKVRLPEFEGAKNDTHKITIMFWFKKEGQKVKQGDELLEVQTDKAIMDIEAPATGRLKKILAQAGKTLTPGKIAGEIEAD